MRFPPVLALLIEELKRLPGIGQKTAQRLAFHLLRAPRERSDSLARALVEMKNRVRRCEKCFNLSENPLCSICTAAGRTTDLLCVVEEPLDLMAIEDTGHFRGGYHVLTGVLSPMRGVGPEDLRIRELLERLKTEKTREVIIATNLDVEGEATASYLASLIKPIGVKVTRIARGIPIGGSLEHADIVTLGLALDRRHEV